MTAVKTPPLAKCARLRGAPAALLAALLFIASPAQAQDPVIVVTPPTNLMLSVHTVTAEAAVLSLTWMHGTSTVEDMLLSAYDVHLREAGGAWNDDEFVDLPAGVSISGTLLEIFIFTGGRTAAFPTARHRPPRLLLNGLQPGLTYEARMKLYDIEGNTSPWSDTVSALAATAPHAPSGVSALPATSGNALMLGWTAPFNGGLDISDYRVRWAAGAGSSAWVAPGMAGIAIGSADTTYALTGLSAGAAYEVQVAAVNSVGTGTFSTSARGTPGEPASPPGVVPEASVSVQNESGMVTLSWDVPAEIGGAAISGYRVRWRVSGETAWQKVGGPTDPTEPADGAAVSARSYTIQNLINGNDYEIQIAALNAAGAGEWSKSYAGAPRGLPGKPALEPLITGYSALLALWDPPADNGGAAIHGYRVQWRVADDNGSPGVWLSPNGSVSSATDATYVGNSKTFYNITSLPDGTTYDVQAAAETQNGIGAWSDSQSGAARGRVSLAPDAAPQPAAPISGDGTLALSWSPPLLAAHFNPITGYRLRWRIANDGGHPGGWQKAGAAADRTDPADGEAVTGTAYTIQNLVNGTRYHFQVAAVNSDGAGRWSPARKATPRTGFTLDLDENGTATWQEGVMLARYSLGLRTTAVTDGLGLSLTETALEDILAYIVGAINSGDLDVDGVTGFSRSDGILIARYLFGVTGDALPVGQTTRTAAELESVLDALMP